MTTHTSAAQWQEWDAIAPGFDRYVTPESSRFGERVLDVVDAGPGVRLLDIAAGSGAVALPAARRGADVVATDLAPRMVERLEARARAEKLSNLTALVMDGTALELSDDRFDITISLNGVSLFPDLVGGLAEMVRVTKPGGQVLVATFGAPRRVEFLGYFMAALQATIADFAPLPMDPPPLPFQVAEPSELHRRLVTAGLAQVHVETVTWKMHFASGAHFWDVVTSSNPIGAALTANLSSDQAHAAQQVLDGMLRERSVCQRGAVLDAEMNIGIGTKPTVWS